MSQVKQGWSIPTEWANQSPDTALKETEAKTECFRQAERRSCSSHDSLSEHVSFNDQCPSLAGWSQLNTPHLHSVNGRRLSSHRHVDWICWGAFFSLAGLWQTTSARSLSSSFRWIMKTQNTVDNSAHPSISPVFTGLWYKHWLILKPALFGLALQRTCTDVTVTQRWRLVRNIFTVASEKPRLFVTCVFDACTFFTLSVCNNFSVKKRAPTTATQEQGLVECEAEAGNKQNYEILFHNLRLLPPDLLSHVQLN